MSLLREMIQYMNRDSDVMEMSAIWMMDNPIRLESGELAARLEPGMEIRVEDGELRDGFATHRILGCFGTILGREQSLMVQEIHGDVIEMINF